MWDYLSLNGLVVLAIILTLVLVALIGCTAISQARLERKLLTYLGKDPACFHSHLSIKQALSLNRPDYYTELHRMAKNSLVEIEQREGVLYARLTKAGRKKAWLLRQTS